MNPSTRAWAIRYKSLRRIPFSKRLVVGWLANGAPDIGNRSQAALKAGSRRNALQSFASSYPHAI